MPFELKCDHMTGFFLTGFPQYGVSDRLVRSSDAIKATVVFNFCPLCDARNRYSMQAQLDRKRLRSLSLVPGPS